ncbi:MAG: MarR family transcriptional regulator [Candidatus Nanopelagicales bacterium]|jgi:DNA-binding MarR family transcriptional regulator|nr:MarR family transcriptional regulator [Candidatus Nanopelagicales bacterium]
MTRWLSPTQQRYWRAWIAGNLLLPDALGRDLVEQTGLSMADYEIMVRLSESEDHRVRMSDLAELTLSSRSRLSHQIDRMHRAGYVDRQKCDDDRRGFFAVLTDKGFDTLKAAAPIHVESVRQRIVDVLTPEEFAELGRITEKLLDALED